MYVLPRTKLGVVSAPWPWSPGSAKQNHEHQTVGRGGMQVVLHMSVDAVWNHGTIAHTANACVRPRLLSTHRSMQQQCPTSPCMIRIVVMRCFGACFRAASAFVSCCFPQAGDNAGDGKGGCVRDAKGFCRRVLTHVMSHITRWKLSGAPSSLQYLTLELPLAFDGKANPCW